jgi:hypothetical protein
VSILRVRALSATAAEPAESETEVEYGGNSINYRIRRAIRTRTTGQAASSALFSGVCASAGKAHGFDPSETA